MSTDYRDFYISGEVVSDCCGAECIGDSLEDCICDECGEHCQGINLEEEEEDKDGNG
jgi:hypothetical protein